MSGPLTEDSASYPATITVPGDGDLRNAASVITGFQGLANRLAHIWVKFANALINGGTIVFNSGVTLDLAAADITIAGGDLQFTTGNLKPTGKIINYCFTANTPGRANRKTLNLAPASASTTNVDPTLYNQVYVNSAAGACSVQIDPATVPVLGDEIEIVVSNSVNAVSFKNTAGVQLLSLLNTTGGWRTGSAYWDGTIWRLGASSPAVP